jgi:hypothetical protein
MHAEQVLQMWRTTDECADKALSFRQPKANTPIAIASHGWIEQAAEWLRFNRA